MPDHPAPAKIPQVDEELCQVCHRCLARKECRVKAIVALDPGEPPFVDAGKCYGCLVCLPACPYGAIQVM